MKQGRSNESILHHYQADILKRGTKMKQVTGCGDQVLCIFFCQFIIFFKEQDCCYRSMGNPSWEKAYLIDILY